MQGLQRVPWDGAPRELGDTWRLVKAGKPLARCVITNHPFGWELRLLIGDDLRRSHVFREQNPLLDTAA